MHEVALSTTQVAYVLEVKFGLKVSSEHSAVATGTGVDLGSHSGDFPEERCRHLLEKVFSSFLDVRANEYLRPLACDRPQMLF